jgi:glycosyltransferase involved in cell wall biosynthesis
MNRLRVAVVSDAIYPWHKGGKEVRYLHLLNELPDHEVDVVVYSMKWWDEAPEILETAFGSLSYRSICPRVAMYRGEKRSLWQAVLFAASTFRLLTRKFDVIEADHMPYLQLLPLRVVAWVKHVPLVITWHEVWGADGWRKYIGRLGFVAAFIERVCVRLPDFIVAVSAGTAEKLVALGAKSDRVVVVPNPLDLDQLLGTVAQIAGPELLFVGRLIGHKQADIAIEAARILLDRGYDVRLGIVGVGPEEDRLRSLAATLGLGTNVIFYGALESQSEVWSLIQGGRVLLAPSIREGFGLVVAESLALGTPAVCVLHSENESSKLVSPVTGSVVPAFDAPALADAAEQWLNDASVRADRVAHFLDDHQELSLGAMGASYADIFRHVV